MRVTKILYSIRKSLFKSPVIILLSILALVPGDAWARKQGKQKITASAVYVFDDSNKKVLFSRNARSKLYPASTVKLLTALVVLDRLELDRRVLVSSQAAGVAPTKAGLSRGGDYSVRDLLKVLLACSANDAGVALAEACAGSQAKFARLMNQKAKTLGARDSYFTNPTGLPDRRQKTTAYDLWLITKTAFSNNFIASCMRQKTVTISGSDAKKIVLKNHNKLLWKLSEPCVLGKTGWTRSAGHCYAGMAHYAGSRRVWIAMMNSRSPWADIRSILKLSRRHET